jgi:hypothetical protein
MVVMDELASPVVKVSMALTEKTVAKAEMVSPVLMDVMVVKVVKDSMVVKDLMVRMVRMVELV